MLRVVSAPELGDVTGDVFSVWGSLFFHPPTPMHTKLHEPALVTFLRYVLALSGAQVKKGPNFPYLIGKAIQLAALGLPGRGAFAKWQEDEAALMSRLDKHKESFLKMALWRLLLPAQMSLPGTGISAQSGNFEKSQENRERSMRQGVP